MPNNTYKSYRQVVFENFKRHRLGHFCLFIILLFCLVGVYAPLLASSKPLTVRWDGTWYFPLLRYFLFSGFYTKSLDLFFNLMMFTLPLFILGFFVLKKHLKVRRAWIAFCIVFQLLLFTYFAFLKPQDPAQDQFLNQKRAEALKKLTALPSFEFDLAYMNNYKKLNMLLKYTLMKKQQERLTVYNEEYEKGALQLYTRQIIREKKASILRQGTYIKNLPSEEYIKKMALSEIPEIVIKANTQMPTLWNITEENKRLELERLKEELKENQYNETAKNSLKYIEDKDKWLKINSAKLDYLIMPLIRDFHFEDDAGGEQGLNRYLPWWELSRTNRKDLLAGLIFGVRVSLVVGVLAVGLSLLIAVPVGAYAGYYGGTFDIIVSRILEVLEAMPTFFMLLMIIAIMQSKSIFLVITMIGLFGWTGFSRYIRGEFFKQRNLAYVESAHALGFNDTKIMFSHILPNAIPPLLTLLPFAMMGAITSEAGLSFLGLGEEGSTSWGVLMDEGRNAFPAESYLLWPPAILLTVLLVAIALVGDGLRDAIDPKMR
jgi:peptide/nickel transport system permease protein